MHLFQLSFRNILITKGGVSKQMSAFMQANCWRLQMQDGGSDFRSSEWSCYQKYQKQVGKYTAIPSLIKACKRNRNAIMLKERSGER